MESLIQRQSEMQEQMKQIKSNFGKDASSRKISDYLMKRLTALDSLWGEFSMNNEQLQLCENKEQQYFLENTFDQAKDFYINLRHTISSYKTEKKHTVDKAIQDGKVNELLSQQRTNFRAFNRVEGGMPRRSYLFASGNFHGYHVGRQQSAFSANGLHYMENELTTDDGLPTLSKNTVARRKMCHNLFKLKKCICTHVVL
ncbi:hypothetical protein evm_011744 [Chilo suppressalis]|nr:hypothetical protein evm_011744 [Chilo suppressalis]